jgi:hypothetical protein
MEREVELYAEMMAEMKRAAAETKRRPRTELKDKLSRPRPSAPHSSPSPPTSAQAGGSRRG